MVFDLKLQDLLNLIFHIFLKTKTFAFYFTTIQEKKRHARGKTSFMSLKKQIDISFKTSRNQ